MIKNCCPHPMNVGEAVLPPCGILPRISFEQEQQGTIDFAGARVPLIVRKRGPVENLPPAEEGVWLLVSVMVFDACPDRTDLLCPGDLVRDDQGRIIGMSNLVTRW